jgi:hypothetical protein
MSKFDAEAFGMEAPLTYAAMWPHEYVVRSPENATMLLALARHIFEHGTHGRFYLLGPQVHHEGRKVYCF